MEVRPDYKQTEVGVIPEGWELKRLAEVGDIRSGGTPSTTEAHFWNGGVPWCTPTDITGLRGRKYLTATARTISAAGLQFSAADVIPPRSLIMTSRATIGECAINMIPMTTNQGFKNIVPFSDVDVEFLYYKMTTQKAGLIALCGGSTFLEIGKKQLRDYQIAVPKGQAEQRAIAGALNDVDALLGGLDRLIAKKRDLKQAAMQQLLTGHTRLPGFHGEWLTVSFESLCRIFTKQTGFDYSATIKPSLTVRDEGTSLPFIQNKDFSGSTTSYETDYFVPERIATKFPEILLDERCLLISISGRVGNVGVFSNVRRAFVGGAIAVAKFKEPKQLGWVMHYFQSYKGQNTLLGNVKAGSHQNLILDDLRKIRLPLPSPEEQESITAVLSTMDEELAELEQRRDKTCDLKQAMMQELLSGKTRLVKPEGAHA